MGSINPSLPVTVDEGKAALETMKQDPRPLDRPLVVAGGIHDPGFLSASIARKVRSITTDDDRVISVSFFGVSTFDRCREKLIEAVQRLAPSDDPAQTVDVDVIGFSMGGIVARHAARPRDDGGRRLVINRLFTISSPHRGARLAILPTLDQRKHERRSGSPFLQSLDEDLEASGYELYTYTRLGDLIVGSENTAPPGMTPWWVSTPPFGMSHTGAHDDPRILADIGRRLRGEPPLATSPATWGLDGSGEDAPDAADGG